jgi:cyclohexa-1,5-dienecarbonyl-CoA hydratase
MPLQTQTCFDGQLERIVLGRPPLNVLDAAMIEAIATHLRSLGDRRELKLLVWDAQGPNFSAGASVAEHLPGRVDAMLSDFHTLFHELEALSVPTAAVVRGQCLGGGCELALATGMVFCEPSARFGLPEVKLGVFPPLASALLPWRVGGARATRLVVTGEILSAEQAVAIGLADVVAPDADTAMRAWFTQSLLPLSAVGIRQAWHAVRLPVRRILEEVLPEIERQYLVELMARHDPGEGLRAFLEKRAPVWQHR